MKRSIKWSFFDIYKCENIVKYKKRSLDKIKALSSYFIEFDKSRSILPKKYPKTCKVKSLNRKPIIIIIYNKIIFLIIIIIKK